MTFENYSFSFDFRTQRISRATANRITSQKRLRKLGQARHGCSTTTAFENSLVLLVGVWIKSSLPSSSRNSEPAFATVSDYSWQPGDEGDVEGRWGPKYPSRRRSLILARLQCAPALVTPGDEVQMPTVACRQWTAPSCFTLMLARVVPSSWRARDRQLVVFRTPRVHSLPAIDWSVSC